MRPTKAEETDLIETADAAQILGLTPAGVRLLARTAKLTPAITTPRGARLFRRVDVQKLAAQRARSRQAAA